LEKNAVRFPELDVTKLTELTLFQARRYQLSQELGRCGKDCDARLLTLKALLNL